MYINKAKLRVNIFNEKNKLFFFYMVSVFHCFTPVILDELVLKTIMELILGGGNQLICYPNSL